MIIVEKNISNGRAKFLNVKQGSFTIERIRGIASIYKQDAFCLRRRISQ